MPGSLRHPTLQLRLETAADYTVLSALFGMQPDITAESAVPALLAMPDLAGLNKRQTPSSSCASNRRAS